MDVVAGSVSSSGSSSVVIVTIGRVHPHVGSIISSLYTFFPFLYCIIIIMLVFYYYYQYHPYYCTVDPPLKVR